MDYFTDGIYRKILLSKLAFSRLSEEQGEKSTSLVADFGESGGRLHFIPSDPEQMTFALTLS